MCIASVAQMVEHTAVKFESNLSWYRIVAGSIPAVSEVLVAQLVEHGSYEPKVPSSILGENTSIIYSVSIE